MARQPWWGPATGCEGPLYSPSPYDIVLIDGRKTPGVATVSAAPKRKVDAKKTAGKDGTTNTSQGNDAVVIAVQVLLWTPDQWEVYQRDVQEKLWPAGGTTKQPPTTVALYHPWLAMWKIAYGNVEGGQTPSPGPAWPQMTFTFRFKEARDPALRRSKVNVTVTPDVTTGLRREYTPPEVAPTNAPQARPIAQGIVGQLATRTE
jgi:hypothetical protein